MHPLGGVTHSSLSVSDFHTVFHMIDFLGWFCYLLKYSLPNITPSSSAVGHVFNLFNQHAKICSKAKGPALSISECFRGKKKAITIMKISLLIGEFSRLKYR